MLWRSSGCLLSAAARVVALLAFGARSVAAEPLPAANAASPIPCVTASSNPRDLPAAFAYDLESPDILRFVRVLAATPERDQRRIFEAAIAAAKERPEQDVEAAVDAQCPRPDAVYGALRATYVIVNDWTLGELKAAAPFRAFDGVVATAVAALSPGEGLTPEQRLTAMRPLAELDLQAPSHPVQSASADCASPSSKARTITLVRPPYPPNAVFARTTGTVKIRVDLSETGDVRSVSVLSDTLGNAIGSEEIRRGTIFAAATTTYAPEMRDCVPRSGSYIFQSDFTGR